jgi:hypothetical protein
MFGPLLVTIGASGVDGTVYDPVYGVDGGTIIVIVAPELEVVLVKPY